jgi:hypothetical protein
MPAAHVAPVRQFIAGRLHPMTITDFTGRMPVLPRALQLRFRPDALPLVAVLAIAGLITGLIAYVAWPSSETPVAPTLPITIAGVAFNVPSAAVRVPGQRRPGAHDRVDLVFLWPSLEPPHLSTNAAVEGMTDISAAERALERVFVTITVAADKLAPAVRVKTIYPRYVVTTPEFLPSGIAVLAFGEGTPYQGEDLIYDSVVPENFLVRCTRNGAGPTPGTCLHERRIEGADLVVRFPRDWLGDWRSVAGNIDRLIVSLRQAKN